LVLQRMTAIALLLTLVSSGVFAITPGERRYSQFVGSLLRGRSGEFVFRESEALVLLNAGAEVLFADTTKVSATPRSVAIRGSTISIVTDLRVMNMTVRPEVTFTAYVAGEHVVLDIERLRVGRVPISVPVMLTALHAANLGDYIQVHPRSGRLVVQKRGAVRQIDAITIGSGVIRVRVEGD